MYLSTFRLRAVAMLLVVALVAAACGGSEDSPTPAAEGGGFPLTFTNCGVEVSVESIIAHEPDIVIGYDTATITHDALADVGIRLYVMPPYCDNPPTPSFESILDEVRFYGKLFGAAETANASAAALEAAVASANDAPVAEGKTAAALYVSSDGSAIYAYSSLGMVHPLMEALGMTNVFAELSERVPEVSIEEVMGRNPEILVLLYDDTDLTPDGISALVTGLRGGGSPCAVRAGDVILSAGHDTAQRPRRPRFGAFTTRLRNSCHATDPVPD